MEQDRCRDLREHYPAFVTGDLPPNLNLRIQQHLGEVCGRCSTEIERLHDAFQRAALAQPSSPLPAGSLGALAAKIGAQSQESHEVPIVFPETNERTLAWTLVLLAAAALIAVGFWAHRVEHRLSKAEVAQGIAEQRTRGGAGDFSRLQQHALGIQNALDAVTNPQVVSADLIAASGEGKVRAFLDLPAGRVVLTMVGLADPAAEQRYEVWWGAAEGWSYLGEIDKAAVKGGAGRFYPLPADAAEGSSVRISLGSVDSPPADTPGPALFEGSF